MTSLRGVGDALAERLRALGVETHDLLFLLPLRYEDRTRLTPLGELKPGQRAAIEGEVLLTEIAFRGRRQLLSRIGDGSGYLTLRFFYFTGQQQQGLARGVRIRCFGEVRRGPKGLEIVHPEYRSVDRESHKRRGRTPDSDIPLHRRLDSRTSSPIGSDGARSDRGDRSQGLARGRARRFAPPSLHEALHYAPPPADAPVNLLPDWRHPAQRRLAFEELLAHQLSLKVLRQRTQQCPGWPLATDGALKAGLLAALPFRPTQAQQRVLGEIEQDLELARPMLRLVQGDVGCGKTWWPLWPRPKP